MGHTTAIQSRLCVLWFSPRVLCIKWKGLLYSTFAVNRYYRDKTSNKWLEHRSHRAGSMLKTIKFAMGMLTTILLFCKLFLVKMEVYETSQNAFLSQKPLFTAFFLRKSEFYRIFLISSLFWFKPEFVLSCNLIVLAETNSSAPTITGSTGLFQNQLQINHHTQ